MKAFDRVAHDVLKRKALLLGYPLWLLRLLLALLLPLKVIRNLPPQLEDQGGTVIASAPEIWLLVPHAVWKTLAIC